MGDGNHYKILIADDREDNLGLLREWLSAQDYYVRCARDGREALDIARQDPPDLVLVDKVMPEVDGLSVARELKRGDPTVPVIVLTGREDTRRSAIFDDTGADDLIMKPFQYEEVETRVRTMLKKREVFRALEQANEELRRANERMSRLIQFDEKTGLYNYRTFMERLAERIRRVTESYRFHGADAPEPSIRITVSAGVATFPLNDRIQRPESLVKAADDALYRAKGAGRNRTHLDQRSLAGAR